ncbi:MAG: hypothetical protein ACOX9C_05290 [Kiritimatiellia bacterium]
MPPPALPSATAPAEPQPGAFEAIAQVMAPSPDAARPGELARRFRLAGTIFGMSNTGADEPVAILDDRINVTQSLVTRSQEVVPGVVLSQVRTDSVVLSGPAGDEEIFLEKTAGSASPAPDAAPAASLDPQAAASRFGGGQVFPNRWEFSRDTLLDYYAELRDEPERLLSIFDSMDPVYVTDPDGARRIEGYVVGVEGEPDFFAAAGLVDGDIVRSVNSLKMTNRRRAEGFIKNFVEGTVSTFVLEVERNGKTTKHVYQIQ